MWGEYGKGARGKCGLSLAFPAKLEASVGGGRECVLVYMRECRLSLASSEITAVSGFTKARKGIRGQGVSVG